MLNVIGCGSSGYSFARTVLDPAPAMLVRYPEIVQHAEEGISRLRAMIALGRPLPAAPSEHVCYGAYGECPAFDLCRWGDK